MEVISGTQHRRCVINFIVLSLLALIILPGISVCGATEFEDSDFHEPHYWYTVAIFNLILHTTANSDEIVVSINGKTIHKGKIVSHKYKDVIHAAIPLEDEVRNYIVVKIHDKEVFTVDLFYAKSYHSAIVPEEYELYLFHTNENESPCLSCHRLKPNKTDFKPLPPSTSLCYPCHKSDFHTGKQQNQSNSKQKKPQVKENAPFSDLDIIAKKSQHAFALVSWQCLDCHQEEAIESEFTPDTFIKFTIREGAQIAPLCYSCHPERKTKNDSFAYVHGPVGMEGCNMCHNPHYSNFAKLLEDKPTNLCIDCHELEKLFNRAYVHAPMAKEGCITCHDPHGSNYMYHLFTDINTLCYRCHKNLAKQKNNHPITGHPVSGPKDPQDPEIPFTCVSCHNPHSSDYEYLLPEEDPMLLCVQCHKMVE